MTMERLFFALWPGDAVRQQLADWRDAWTWPNGAAPVPNPKLHLTLHFLGAVDEEGVQALLAAPNTPFQQMHIDLGVPAIWHNQIAVLEPIKPPAALFELHAALGRQLESLGFVLEQRSYRPHVTMSRRASGAVAPQARSLSWLADEYALVSSRDGVYTPLRVFRCSGAD
jgi:2'-5' RNA ligase